MSDVAMQIPDSFDFNETDVSRPKPAQYREGVFKGEIVRMASVLSKTNNMQLEFGIRAVDESGAVAGPEIRHYVAIPLPNPQVPGHTPFTATAKQTTGQVRDRMYGKARDLIRAVGIVLPAFPKKRDSGQYYDPDTDETLTPLEQRAKAQAVDMSTLAQLQAWWIAGRKKEEPLVGKQLYFETYRNGQYTNVQYVRGTAPDGKEVIWSDFTGEVPF